MTSPPPHQSAVLACFRVYFSYKLQVTVMFKSLHILWLNLRTSIILQGFNIQFLILVPVLFFSSQWTIFFPTFFAFCSFLVLNIIVLMEFFFFGLNVDFMAAYPQTSSFHDLMLLCSSRDSITGVISSLYPFFAATESATRHIPLF